MFFSRGTHECLGRAWLPGCVCRCACMRERGHSCPGVLEQGRSELCPSSTGSSRTGRRSGAERSR